MKCLIIIDSTNNGANIALSAAYQRLFINSSVDCTVMDMGQGSLMEHEKFYMIQKEDPDFIMTFDLAGFECRNGMNNVSLNNIPCRMYHILTHRPKEGSITQEEIFNYSMYFGVIDNVTAEMLSKNDSIKHIVINSQLKDLTKTKENLQMIWHETELDIDFSNYLVDF